ncbi:MAG TPA: response regulator [Bacteroidota bacterium]|nr:response regulator [Bacteroidota bacterium]
MESSSTIKVLLVDDNRDFATLVQVFLRRHQPQKFTVTWRGDSVSAEAAVRNDGPFDVILMDYFLPGQNGLEITKSLRSQGVNVPIIFLTVNKDFDLAVEVLKLGVADYLLKEDATTPVLPGTILKVIEQQRLEEQRVSLEVTRKRLEAIQEMVGKMTTDLRGPLDVMALRVNQLMEAHTNDGLTSYLVIIRDNLQRIEKKISQLKELKSDKTIPYIRDIRMFDLSE